MKKIINGKKYNTETAKFCGEDGNFLLKKKIGSNGTYAEKR